MKENIVFISWKDLYYPPDRDGGVSLFEKYIDFLINQNNKVIHFLTAKGYSGWEYVRQKSDYQEQCLSFSPVNNLNVHRINIDQNLDLRKYNNAKNKFEKRLVISDAEAKSLELLKLDLDSITRIHIFHVSHAIHAVLGNKLPIEKVILHPMMTWIGYRKYTEVPEEYIEAEKKTFERVRIIQTPSLEEKRYLTEYYNVDSSKIIVNSRGYDEKSFVPKQRNLPKNWETINIICANMVRSQKGQKYFIPFAELCRKHGIKVKIQLIWVNWNSYDEEYIRYYIDLKSEIKEKGLDEYIIFYDVMSHEKLNEIMESSHFSIITSIYETFWKSALESSATWLPTIVFDDVNAFQEFITSDVNWIIVKRDLEARNLFDSFIRLVNNPDVYESISINWIKMGASYCWNSLFKDMENDINIKMNKIWQ